MAALIGCDIHPLNNLRVGKAPARSLRRRSGRRRRLGRRAGSSPAFDALEQMVEKHGAGWCFGAAPTLATAI
jgi:maleylpyruvate isomerase